MEFNEKLQELRKQKGLTQEAVAEALFVSRTAVSKWESGKGYPNIDSLKAIAAFYGVTVDALLAGDELLSLAQEERSKKLARLRGMVYNLLDIGAVLLLVLPLFASRVGDAVLTSPLISAALATPWLKAVYCVLIAVMFLYGAAGCIVGSLCSESRQRMLQMVSLVLNSAAVLIFVVGLQPYPATFAFASLLLKFLLLLRGK